MLYSFAGLRSGTAPLGGVVLDAAGNLYGTTSVGGALLCGEGSGCGVVFALSPEGQETVLHLFAGPPLDGWQPVSGIYRNDVGNLLGTTGLGGSGPCSPDGCGVVFRLAPTGKETILHNFTGVPDDGDGPNAGLVRDGAGNFYGTTGGGGSNPGPNGEGCGTVFKLRP